MAATTSQPNVSGSSVPGPGAWVGFAPDGSVIPAPYLHGAPPVPADRPSVATAARRRRAPVVVFGAAVPIAVLAAVAPFLHLWRYTFDDGGFAAQTVVNGWGSVSAQPASFATSHSHDTNYGLPMIFAAVLLLVGAALYLVTRRAVVAGLPISIGATLAAGTALVLALDRGGRDSASTGSDSWAVGPGFWLIMAAGVLGVLVTLAAAILTAVELRVEPRTSHQGETPDASRAGPATPAWFEHPDAARFGPTDPARFGPTDPARFGPTDPARFVPADPAGFAPIDPAQFAPPWAP